MSRRTRKTARKTPLSMIDIMIYFVVMVILGIVLPFFVLFLFLSYLPDRIAFADETVILNYNRFGIFTSTLLFYTLFMMFLVPISYALTNRIPLFGNKRFKPKPFERIIPTYSLFSDDFKKNILTDFDKKVSIYIRVSIACLVISLIAAPLGLCPRITYDTSDTIKFYNVFNTCTGEYHWFDVTDFEIDISYMRRSTQMEIDIYYTLDGKTREILGSSNYFKDYEERLRYYIHLKDYFDEGEYTVNSEDIDRLISTNDFTSEEIQLIYELYDYTP